MMTDIDTSRMKMPSRPHNERLGKVPSKIGTARKMWAKKRKRTGKRRTRWTCNG